MQHRCLRHVFCHRRLPASASLSGCHQESAWASASKAASDLSGNRSTPGAELFGGENTADILKTETTQATREVDP